MPTQQRDRQHDLYHQLQQMMQIHVPLLRLVLQYQPSVGMLNEAALLASTSGQRVVIALVRV